MINPLKEIRPGFGAHPLGQFTRKTVLLQERGDALMQKFFGLESERPVEASGIVNAFITRGTLGRAAGGFRSWADHSLALSRHNCVGVEATE